MNSAVLVAVWVVVPLVCLGLLMTLSWFEDSPEDEVKKRELSHPRVPTLTRTDRTATPVPRPTRRRTDIALH